jgi:hypothetical protein
MMMMILQVNGNGNDNNGLGLRFILLDDSAGTSSVGSLAEPNGAAVPVVGSVQPSDDVDPFSFLKL